MDKCLLKKVNYDMNRGFVPIMIDDKPVLAGLLQKLLTNQEVAKLTEYVDKVFANVDDNRRRKFAVVENRNATKFICRRIKQKQYKINGNIYEFSHYCDEIEIVRWIKDKCVSDKQYCDMTGNRYRESQTTDDIMYITCVVGLESAKSVTKVVNSPVRIQDYRLADQSRHYDDQSSSEDELPLVRVRISDTYALMYNETDIKLVEEISQVDHTQIYFHMAYRAKVTEE